MAAGTKQAGFTLIELMVTLAATAVTLAIGVPSFQTFMANQRQVTAINELVMAMTLARSEAVKQTRNVTLCKSADGSQCGGAGVGWAAGWIVFANTSELNTATREAAEPVIRAFPAITGARTLTTPDIAAQFISFRPTGTSSVCGTWILCDARGAAHATAVVVNAAGRASASHTQADDSALECPE
jgi:type IV fimbrial biogenesis protein FimT